MNFQITATIAVFIFMAVSYSLNKIPMGTTSVIGLVVLCLFGCIQPSDALANIGSSTVLTMASMFIVSAGLNKSSMLDRLSTLVNRAAGGSFTKVLASYVIITFILGQFMPTTTATVALICPLVVTACRKLGVNPSKMLYSIALVTVVSSWTFTMAGPYAGNYLECNGMLEEYGFTGISFSIFDEMIDKLPASIFAVLWAIFFAPKFAPDIKDPGLSEFIPAPEKSGSCLSPVREFLGYGCFLIVVFNLIFNPFKLAGWIIPMAAAALLVASGVLSGKEAIDSMGIDIILIYVGAASLGNAFSTTGAGDIIGSKVASVFSGNANSLIIGGAFFAASYIMTSLLYNRAVSRILIPLILVTASSMGADPRGLMRMCYIGSMCSLITPMATTAVPVIMGYGGYSQKHLIKMNIIPAVLLALITVFFVMNRFPCYN